MPVKTLLQHLEAEMPYLAECLKYRSRLNDCLSTAQRAIQSGQIREALNTVARCRECVGRSPLTDLVEAQAHLAAGRTDTAAETLTHLVGLEPALCIPDSSLLVTNIADLALPLLVLCLAADGESGRAVDVVCDLYEAGRAGDQAALRSSSILRANGFPEPALKLAELVLERTGTRVVREEALKQALSILLDQDRPYEALDLFLSSGLEGSSALNPKGILNVSSDDKGVSRRSVMAFQAKLLYVLGRPDDAKTKCQEYLREFVPDSAPVQDLACYSWSLGDDEFSLWCFERIAESGIPDQSPEFLTALGEAFLRSGANSDAMQCFKLAIQADPNYAPTKAALEQLRIHTSMDPVIRDNMIEPAPSAKDRESNHLRLEETNKKEPVSVLIASPVRQDPDILREFLRGLNELLLDGISVDYLFVDDNDRAEASKALRDFRPRSGQVMVLPLQGKTGTSAKYLKDDVTHRWTEDLIEKVALVKDFILEFALMEGYHYVFLVDSDIVVHPMTLQQLVSTGKDVVSQVFWSKFRPDQPEFPQVWVSDQYSFVKVRKEEGLTEDQIRERIGRFLSSLRTPGIYPVGGLGACTLISREALAAGARFRGIDNISLWGEDRHFCVRARALGLSLNAETGQAPLHLYRREDLKRVEPFWASVREDVERQRLRPDRYRKGSGNKLTLSMLVRNESGRYLEEVLKDALSYVDRAVILDDASDDDTRDICRKMCREAGVPLVLVTNPTHGFYNEVRLRKQQWELTAATDPDWILILDADEIFEDRMKTEVRRLMDQTTYDWYGFRLYDFWNRTHYREDKYWSAHQKYFVTLVRFRPDVKYSWAERPVHCGRIPLNLPKVLPGYASDLRIKHLGWANPSDRRKKYERYLESDPLGKYGILEQYKSIMDQEPHLVRWVE